MWDRFDEATSRLAAALTGDSPAALAAAFHELSDIAGLLAADLQREYRPARVR
jgi:hypothetical protein